MPFKGVLPCGCIQGHGALLIKGIEGDYYTIMGLPVSRTVQTLAHFL